MLGSVEAGFKKGIEDYSIGLANLEQDELMTLRSNIGKGRRISWKKK